MPISLTTPIIPTGLLELYNKVIQAGQIHNAMAISNFLNPKEEEEEIEQATSDEIL